MKNLVRESLLTEKMETEQVIVTVRKGSGENLKKLLDHIKEIGNIGHSFEIVVDPDNKEYKESFGWDGDGSDRIESVELK